jgi:putative ABC transport system permease protein
MTFADLVWLYRGRLRSRSAVVRDVFAIVGIAVGVALLFASQVASTSLEGSVQQLSSELVGRTQYQLDARGPNGVSERLLAEVRHIPGVKLALPVLEQQANLIGSAGQQQSVDLIGTDPEFARFSGELLQKASAAQLAGQRAIALPGAIANSVGVQAFQTVQIQIGAQRVKTLVGATLSESEIGGLAHSPVALAPILYAQQVTGLEGRITRVFVEARAGHNASVQAGLRGLAAARNVSLEPASFDAKLFDVASLPENQSETLFSAISAIVGFLLAFNAVLLTIPGRRQLLSNLRYQGANRAVRRQILLFDALIIGALACGLGLILGDALSSVSFSSTPGYLSFAFPVGNDRIVDARTVVLAVAAGMAAAAGGVLWPLRDMFLLPREHKSIPRRWWVAGRIIVGLMGFAVTTTILFAYPQASEIGSFTLVVALLCALPFHFDAVVSGFTKLQRRIDQPSLRLTAIHLQTPPTRLRTLAIVATSAVAVFGIVAIQGAQQNLQSGLHASAHDLDSSADIWVTPRGEANAFATTSFTDTQSSALARLPGVRNIGMYRGSFLTWGDRRLWILAPPANSASPVPAREIVSGNLNNASAKLRSGGWAVVSQALASEHGLHVGAAFTLPSPHSRSFRVAALSTNMGWPPGSIIMNASDYAGAWGSSRPSGYEIQTDPGVSASSVRRLVLAKLGPSTGLVVETASEREQRHDMLTRQGLLRLTQIRILVLVAAMLALAGALGSLIWQRRGFMAFARLTGVPKATLRRWVLCEGVVLLSIGCLAGAVFGIYGQLLLSHALASVTGFPINFNIGALVALSTFAIVGGAAVAVVAVVGYLMVRVPPSAARPTS